MVNLCATGVVVEVAMVVGTGAETILVHTEKTSALSVLCTKNYGLRGLIIFQSPGCSLTGD